MKTIVGLLLSLVVFCVYLSTLSSTIQVEDCGELASAVSTLGITHPTGYPLLTLLGWVVAHLPFHARVIWKLNVFVAIICSAAVFFFYRLFLFLLSKRTLAKLGASANAGVKRRKEAPSEPAGSWERIAAGIGVLVLAFSNTYWSQAVSFEVYSLHLLFLSLVIQLFLKSVMETSLHPGPAANRWWYAFAFVLGLSFSNHMMTILLAPAFLYLYFATHGFVRNSWTRIAKSALPFLLGLAPYLYLPLRAFQHPLMNWGNPVSPRGFLWLVSGEQYQDAMFSSFDVTVKQFKYFLDTIGPEFGFVPLVFALLGWVWLFRKAKRMWMFSSLLFVGCLLYSVNYDFPIIKPYFLLAYVTTAIWIVYGIHALLHYAKGRAWQGLAGILCLSLVFFPLYFNYRDVDESRNYVVEDYARNILGSLDSNAVILSKDFEYFTSPASYLQLVEGLRSDVTIIDVGLLLVHWSQLEYRYPWLIQNSKPEIDTFLHEWNVGYSIPLDKTTFSARFKEVVGSIISKNYATRPIYVGAEFRVNNMEGFQSIPVGLVFQVFRNDKPPSLNPPKDFSFRPFSKSDIYTERVRAYYATAYGNQGIYRIRSGDTATGVVYLRKALSLQPDFPAVVAWLNRLI